MQSSSSSTSATTTRPRSLIERSLSRFSASRSSGSSASSHSRRLFSKSKAQAPSSASNKKKVSFSKRVVVCPTLHLDNYTEAETQASFYQSEDYKKINRDIRFTLDLIESGLPIEDMEFCRRGIEFKTSEGAALRSNNRTRSLLAVLSTQDYHWEDPTSTQPADEAIAEAYAKEVVESVSLAYLTGSLDEQVVDKKHIQQTKSSSATTLPSRSALMGHMNNRQRRHHRIARTSAV